MTRQKRAAAPRAIRHFVARDSREVPILGTFACVEICVVISRCYGSHANANRGVWSVRAARHDEARW